MRKKILENATTTSIILDEKHMEFIRKHHFHLSSFVREQLDKLIEKYEKLEEG